MRGLFLLTSACAIWGLAFAATRWTLTDYSPIWSHCLRYIFAGIIALPVLFIRKGFENVKGALYCAIALMIALQFQTIGIAYTTMAKAGFLTVFYAVFTPILSLILLKQRMRKTFWALLGAAMFGMFMICGMEFSGFNKGDVFVLISAFFFSIHILLIDHYAGETDAINFNFLQCVFLGIISLIFGLLYEGPVSLLPIITFETFSLTSTLSGFIILSVFSSLLAFSLQVYAQKSTPAHIVGLIILSESIFAAIFGRVFFNEEITTMGYFGGVIILLSVALIPRFASISKSSLESNS